MARVPLPRCLPLLGLLALAALPTCAQTPADVRPDAVFGAALDANGASAQIAPKSAYGTAPLTVECWAKLDSARTYNIVIANEAKSSATHWEFFTWPENGTFWVYAPGRKPDHYASGAAIVDGKWHYLAMVMEPTRVRLYVDGQQKSDTPSVAPAAAGAPGILAVGTLAEGGLTCTGLVDEVRLSKVARVIDGVPAKEFAADADTIGLWHLNKAEAGKYKDASALGNDAVLKKDTTAVIVGEEHVAGGMPAEFQPLPQEDAAPLRQALKATCQRLGLKSVAAEGVRDGVLREWSRDIRWYGGQDYPESRPTGADPEAVKREVLDKQALIWDTDGGPVGTVLRRTQALADHLKGAGIGERIAGPLADLALVRAVYEKEQPARGTEAHQGLYLAACAVRRQIALSNPLLDFDTILCAARGTFADSVRTNPATQDYQGGHFVTQYFGFNALPGGGVYLVSGFKGEPKVVNVLESAVVQNGRFKGKKLDFGAFEGPDLSYDGKRIVFAWTANKEHKWTYSKNTCWHLFRVNVDGSDLTQLTDGAYSDFDPCWLPNGRIAFASERRNGYIRCFGASLKVRNYTIFSARDDGSDITPLSYYETSEWHPSVNNDGQLVYTRWDYTDRENCLGSRIWIAGVDGTNPRAPHGNYPQPYDTFVGHTPWKVQPVGRETDSRMGAPLVEMGIRAIPGSHKYIFTGAPHHGEVFGCLCLLDLRTEDDDHTSQVRRITPDETFPETEMPNRRQYKYGTPWPLSEGFYLCNSWENLVLVDRFGNKELLCELDRLPCKPDERLRIINPTPLRARPVPPTLPANTRHDNPQAPPATISVMNVYNSDLPFPKDTKIKWLRVTQDILKENHAMGEPLIGYERENTPRIPLGVVPVEADGSAYFEAPVAKELIFQALDDQYRAVQSMRSVAFVHPGERLTCQGCHENTHRTPALAKQPLALQREPSKLKPEVGPIEPMSYYRAIKPIFDRTCVACHKAKGKGPQNMSYEALREDAFWFSGAMYTDMCTPYSGIHGGSRTIPGRFGARNCRIGKALFDETHLKAVSAEDRHKVVLWLDSNSLRLTAFVKEDAQLKGELVWPTLDVDPANPQGTETSGPPLKGNFWHESQYGPHAYLCSDHVHDKVFVIDETGVVRWEYPVPHPQDVWMLPNGNILTTYYQGVREVARDKQIVWEYKTKSPNEIPNCQPLPDGNTMIGIVGECRLIEVNRKGEIVHQVQLATTEKTPHAQFRMCRKTPEGTYLVPFTAEGAVREYDRDGKVIREFPRRSSPVAALRLYNGNTLISAGGMVTEYAPNGTVVWELTPNDIPDINIAVFAGLQRLPNGNTVVCNWNTRDDGDREGAHIFEVTPDKRVVWQVTGTQVSQVAQCQFLKGDLTARADGVVR